jgi:hypothetical protein
LFTGHEGSVFGSQGCGSGVLFTGHEGSVLGSHSSHFPFKSQILSRVSPVRCVGEPPQAASAMVAKSVAIVMVVL